MNFPTTKNRSSSPLLKERYPTVAGLKGFFLILFCLFIFWLFEFAHPGLAQTFTSESYRIDWGNFNITSGKKNSANYNLTDTVGQIAPGQYDSNGYIVKSGFQYIYDTLSKFSFNIDDLDISFGTLALGVASTDSNILTITSPSGKGYQILVGQSHPLSLTSGTTIPDTSCDSSGCTINSSAPWTSSTTYGFGFNAQGVGTSGENTNIGTSQFFASPQHFRPFAAPPFLPQTLMAEFSSVKDRRARITYKVNVSPLQAAGNYQNALIFTAVPNY
jgi:hypothetical protein